MSPLAYVKEVTKQYSHLLNVYVTQAMHKWSESESQGLRVLAL